MDSDTSSESTQPGDIALCLSGGGFRASLFHLGALRRLNELGILSKVDAISSVSGGSILSAFTAERIMPWPDPGSAFTAWDARVRDPFWTFASKNIRTWPLLRRALPWNWSRGTAIESLVKTYQKHINASPLRDLPEYPHRILCATDLSFGVNFTFQRDSVGDYQLGWAPPPTELTTGRAVAASACFPPVFAPMRLDLVDAQLARGRFPSGPKRDEILSRLRLSDGGVYDNMGLEPVWKRFKTVLVSDGGAVFDHSPDRGALWQLMRYSSIVGLQASSIRKRWLISAFQDKKLYGTYWGIGSASESYGRSFVGYSKELARRVIAEVRTDLDSFSASERGVLENHGYFLTEAAIQTHARELIEIKAPLVIPNPHYMDEDSVSRLLAGSYKLKLPFGRWR